MGLLNSIFGNNELNNKIQELENTNSEMEAKIAILENEKAALESLLTPEMQDLESLKNKLLNLRLNLHIKNQCKNKN